MKESNINNHLLSLVWLLLLILPTNNLLNVFVPIAFISMYRYQRSQRVIIMPLIVILSISLIITLVLNFTDRYIDSKDIYKCIALIIIIISFSRLRGIKILKPYILIAIIYIILSQFAFALNISSVVDIIKTYYPYDGDKDMYGYLERYSFNSFGTDRLGGIYYNANQYARYIQLAMIVLLCEVKQFNKKELLVLIPLIILSIIATGSRTSLIVLVFIGLFYMYFNKKITIRNTVLLSVIGLVVSVYLFDIINIADFRLFKVDEGLDNSFGVKLSLFDNYLSELNNPVQMLFGNLASKTSNTINSSFHGTDFDIGNLPILYGFVFFIILLIFFVSIYRKMDPSFKVVFPILLWMFSSSIICNYRTAPIVMLMLGLYYKRSLNKEI